MADTTKTMDAAGIREQALEDIIKVIDKAFPFPSNTTGQTTDDFIRSLSSDAQKNLLVSLKMNMSIAKPDENFTENYKSSARAVVERNIDYTEKREFPEIESPLYLASMRHYYASIATKKASELLENPETERVLQGDLKHFIVTMQAIQNHGTRVFDDKNGKPTTYSQEGLLSIIPQASPYSSTLPNHDMHQKPPIPGLGMP
jgi:hypothetical protein